jgi:hypothetical protein
MELVPVKGKPDTALALTPRTRSCRLSFGLAGSGRPAIQTVVRFGSTTSPVARCVKDVACPLVGTRDSVAHYRLLIRMQCTYEASTYEAQLYLIS